jgi:LacI family gluconate utilization system Gnt-I transcriptional repressor
MSTSRKPATIDDVARLAGVSAMTVSRAFNTPTKLSGETLKKVQEAVDKLEYVPNAMATGLRGSRARMVAALLPTLVGPVFQELVKALAAALADRGYQLMIGQTGYDPVQEESFIKTIVQRRPDGIVIVGVVSSEGARNALRASKIPVVETWDLTDNPVDMVVGFSHTEIGRHVADFFSQRGHSEVAIITADDSRARTRAKAYIDQSLASGAKTAECFFTTAPSTLGEGRRGLSQLLKAHPGITAVFCSSDSLALGASIEAQRLGIEVPKRLAIVGLGDQSFAQEAYPPLTTVRLDGTKIGALAAELMMARAERRPVENSVVDVGFYMIERDSS